MERGKLGRLECGVADHSRGSSTSKFLTGLGSGVKAYVSSSPYNPLTSVAESTGYGIGVGLVTGLIVAGAMAVRVYGG